MSRRITLLVAFLCAALSLPAGAIAQSSPDLDQAALDAEERFYHLLSGFRESRGLGEVPSPEDMRSEARRIAQRMATSHDRGAQPDDYADVCCVEGDLGLQYGTGWVPLSFGEPFTSDDVNNGVEQVFLSLLNAYAKCEQVARPDMDHLAVGAAVGWHSQDDGWILYISYSLRNHDGTYDGPIVRSHDGSKVGNTSACDEYAGEPTGGAIIERKEVPSPGDAPPRAPKRLAGASRIETANAIALDEFGAADTVLISRDDTYADALAGAPVARNLDAPVLLNPTGQLDPTVAGTLDKLGTDTVILLGGTGALSNQVADSLQEIGLAVERIAGTNRWDTAAAAAERLGSDTGHAYLVEGADPNPARGWPDAVAAAPLASAAGDPILLTDTDMLPGETRDAIAALGIDTVTIVGGTAAVSADVADELQADGATVERISGASRYETSAKVAARHAKLPGSSWSQVWLATGLNWPDALAAGPAVAASGGVLALIHGTDVEQAREHIDYLWGYGGDINDVTLLGGTGTITDEVADATSRLN